LKSWSSAAGLALAALALAAGAFIAAHHPLSPALALAAFGAWAACAWRWPRAWWFVVPALLPAASLAPWTGWQMVDEFDLLLLGTLAAGHARLAQQGGARWPAVALALLGVAALGLWRGWLDAGGGALGWFHSYPDAGNSLRVARGIVYAALCAPLIAQGLADDPAGSLRCWRQGMLTGLGVVVAATLWERLAYPGLLDFGQVYRTTALFWEMHVGGAAIDAYFALTIPFVAWALHEARSRAEWALWALFALAVAYSTLTTFSRGLYGAALLGLLVVGAGLWRRDALHGALRLAAAAAAALACGVVLAAAYQAGGWGGVALLWLLAAAVLLLWRRPAWSWRRYAALALAAGVLTEGAAVLGPDSFMRQRWAASDPDLTTRWQHWQQAVRAIDSPADALAGIGLGRMPAHYAASGPAHEWSGTLRWHAGGEAPGDVAHVELGGPTTLRRRGGSFSLTQRIAPPPAGPVRVTFTARVDAPAEMIVRLCERHLLYDRRCSRADLRWSQPVPGWQTASGVLGGAPWRGGTGRGAVLSLSVVNAGGAVDLSRVELVGADGRQRLANPRFADGLAHWLPVAQEYFLPWHIDNMYLDWAVEAGLLGLGVFLWLGGQALRGLAAAAPLVGSAVPFVTASVLALLALGAVVSVLDMPRLCFLMLLCLLLGRALGRHAPRSRGGSQTH
jgi:hypothetical protein